MIPDADHDALLDELDDLLRHAPAEAAIDGIEGELLLIALECRDARPTERPGRWEEGR